LRRVAPMADNNTLRGFLAKFLFMGEDVFKNVSTLSGGEKGRLALAKLIYSQKNVLVLDEPTNHLDIPSRESLENALEEYDGTIITVSHDRFFLDKIANQMLSFEKDGSVTSFDGNYTEYHDWKLSGRESGLTSKPRISAPVEAASVLPATPPANGLSKNQRDKIEKRIAQLESDIAKTEAEVAQLSAEMSSPEVTGDYAKLEKVTKRFREKEKFIEKLYAEWETAANELK